MNLLKEFLDRKQKHLTLADEYEAAGSLEMAYLALWSVTEHTVAGIETFRKTKELTRSVTEWYLFLTEKKQIKRPKIIKSFSCEVNGIPEINLIKKELGEIPAISKLLQPSNNKGISSKFRDKRNSIAHRAEKFRNKEVFNEYKLVAHAAIDELEEKFKQKEVNE